MWSITYLRAEVGDDDELLEDVLGEDVGVAGLLDVVGGHVDVVSAQVQVGGGDGSDAPLSLGREGLRLVVTQRRRDDLVSVLVHRPAKQLKLFKWIDGGSDLCSWVTSWEVFWSVCSNSKAVTVAAWPSTLRSTVGWTGGAWWVQNEHSPTPVHTDSSSTTAVTPRYHRAKETSWLNCGWNQMRQTVYIQIPRCDLLGGGGCDLLGGGGGCDLLGGGGCDLLGGGGCDLLGGGGGCDLLGGGGCDLLGGGGGCDLLGGGGCDLLGGGGCDLLGGGGGCDLLGGGGCDLLGGGGCDLLGGGGCDLLGGGGCELRLFLSLFLYLCDLETLGWRRADLHPEDDVTDLRLSQGRYVHTEIKHKPLQLPNTFPQQTVFGINWTSTLKRRHFWILVDQHTDWPGIVRTCFSCRSLRGWGPWAAPRLSSTPRPSVSARCDAAPSPSSCPASGSSCCNQLLWVFFNVFAIQSLFTCSARRIRMP